MMGKIGAVMGVIAMALLIHGKNYFNAYTFQQIIFFIPILYFLFQEAIRSVIWQ